MASLMPTTVDVNSDENYDHLFDAASAAAATGLSPDAAPPALPVALPFAPAPSHAMGDTTAHLPTQEEIYDLDMWVRRPLADLDYVDWSAPLPFYVRQALYPRPEPRDVDNVALHCEVFAPPKARRGGERKSTIVTIPARRRR